MASNKYTYFAPGTKWEDIPEEDTIDIIGNNMETDS